MKMIRTFFLLAPIGIFLLVVLAASGGGSTASSEPIQIVASKQKIEQYADYATQLGVPWDIVLLSDVLNTEKTGQKGVEAVNPTYTTLDFLRAQVEVEHYEVVGTETHTDPETGDEYEVDVYDWVYSRTDEYIAKNDILSYIGVTESESPNLTPQEAINKLNEKAANDSNSEWRYKAAFLVNTDYEIVLKEYLQLSPAHVENIMKLYTSAYMDSWLPEDSKKRIYAMLDDAGLVQEVRSSVSKNYAGVKFTDTETPVVYYNQSDSRWANKDYAGKSISESGCGPTSLAIVVSTLTGKSYDPPTVCEWAKNGKYYYYGKGSSHSIIPDGAKHYGLQVSGAKTSEGQRIIDALSEGKLVIAIMGPGKFTRGGHFIVLRGITEDGKILVADPGSQQRSNQKWDLSLILSQAKENAQAGGPFWIISK